MEKFKQEVQLGYTFSGANIVLGCAMYDGQAIDQLQVKAPLRMFNRHGLIAGATGTGKTKTLQSIAEKLSDNGVSVVLMDIKGDLSGISQRGTPNDKIAERHQKIGDTWQPAHYPAEFLTISKENGVKLRATVSEFGPVLFSKILDLNDVQGGVVSLIFKYCDDKQLPLLDLADFKKTVQFLTNEGKQEIQKEYGAISPATTSTIIRKIIELEQQGAEQFFGEKSFDTNDLIKISDEGKGAINIYGSEQSPSPIAPVCEPHP